MTASLYLCLRRLARAAVVVDATDLLADVTPVESQLGRAPDLACSPFCLRVSMTLGGMTASPATAWLPRPASSSDSTISPSSTSSSPTYSTSFAVISPRSSAPEGAIPSPGSPAASPEATGSCVS